MRFSEAEIESIKLGHESRNKQLRQTLVDRGVDLAAPRQIECHFWAWSGDDAASVANDLLQRGFEILAQRPAGSTRDPDLWNVEAAIMQSVELTLRPQFTDELVRLAAARSGRYDGWGTRL